MFYKPKITKMLKTLFQNINVQSNIVDFILQVKPHFSGYKLINLTVQLPYT